MLSNKFYSLITLLVILLGAACNGQLSRNENHVSLLKRETAMLRDSIQQLGLTLDSLKKYGRLKSFVEAFYGSLELTEEENNRQYTQGGVQFDLGNFNSLIREDALFSRERVRKLSDPNYHDRCYIGLKRINKIDTLYPSGLGSIKVKVNTTAIYGIYEVGTFENEEELILIDERGLIRLSLWRDIGLSSMRVSNYPELENFSQQDFYSIMGSINFQ